MHLLKFDSLSLLSTSDSHVMLRDLTDLEVYIGQIWTFSLPLEAKYKQISCTTLMVIISSFESKEALLVVLVPTNPFYCVYWKDWLSVLVKRSHIFSVVCLGWTFGHYRLCETVKRRSSIAAMTAFIEIRK